jgi:serine protease Do
VPVRMVAGLLALGILLAGCGGAPEPGVTPATPGSTEAPAPSPDTAPPPGAGTAVSLPDLIARVEPSVVTVRLPRGVGSGVVYRDDIVVTNQHVVGDARQVTLQFADGTSAPGEVLAADRISDLAVIRSARGGLPPLPLRTDLPRRGETALALGSPLGLENTVTAGIVSAVGRELPGRLPGTPIGLIQTDAAISPGNSGGALVDDAGRLIGINEIYIPPGAGAVSLGFAIPSATMVDVVEQLLTRGDVTHPYLGVALTALTPQIRERLGVQAPAGPVVVEVDPNGPAARAGLVPGDVITGFAGEPVGGEQDLVGRLARTRPGETVPVTVARDGASRTLQVVVGDRPA